MTDVFDDGITHQAPAVRVRIHMLIHRSIVPEIPILQLNSLANGGIIQRACTLISIVLHVTKNFLPIFQKEILSNHQLLPTNVTFFNS